LQRENVKEIVAKALHTREQIGVKRQAVESGMLGPVASQDPQRPIVVKEHVAGVWEQKLAVGQSDQNEQSKDEDAEEDVNAERSGPE
jgi:hypothetical protein